MSSPAAGWYKDPDPSGDGQRYWDGAIWTQDVRPASTMLTTPTMPTALASAEVASEAHSAGAEDGPAPDPEEAAKKKRFTGLRRSDKLSKTAISARHVRAVAARGQGPSAGLIRQLIRWSLEVMVSLAFAYLSAIALSEVIGADAVRLSFVTAGPILLALRAAPAALALPGPFHALLGSVPVVAVSGRTADMPAAAASALAPALLLSMVSLSPWPLALLVVVDIAPLVFGGDYRQTFGDSVAGVQVVAR